MRIQIWNHEVPAYWCLAIKSVFWKLNFFLAYRTAKIICSLGRNYCGIINFCQTYKLYSSGISEFHLAENIFIITNFFFFSAEVLLTFMCIQQFKIISIHYLSVNNLWVNIFSLYFLKGILFVTNGGNFWRYFNSEIILVLGKDGCSLGMQSGNGRCGSIINFGKL